MELIEAKDITKIYRIGEIQVKALSNVSLTIEKGEFLAVMGPSGSGKSTFISQRAGSISWRVSVSEILTGMSLRASGTKK